MQSPPLISADTLALRNSGEELASDGESAFHPLRTLAECPLPTHCGHNEAVKQEAHVDSRTASNFRIGSLRLPRPRFLPNTSGSRRSHVLQLGLALELNQLGLNPERAIAVIESDMHSVAMAFSHAAMQGPPVGEFELPFFLYFDPSGLSDLMIDRGEDRAVRSFVYAGLGQLKEQFDTWGTSGGLTRLSLVNVSALLWEIGSYSAFQFDDLSPDQVYEAVRVWASPYIHNEPYYGSDT